MSPMSNDKGSVLVFVTLMIVLLMIMVGLGLDTGELVYTRSTGQAAVDAAALSAITALPKAQADNNPSLVVNRATAFVSKNDYTGSSKNQITSANVGYVKYDFLTDKITNYNEPLATANGVRVALEGGTAMKTPAFLTPFLNLFGASAPGSNNVSVSAVSVMTGRPSIPIAMWSTECGAGNSTKTVVLKMQKPGSENACWTTYLDKSSGAPDIKALFDASESCTSLPVADIDKGTPIYENKGSVTSVYDTAKNFFLKYAPRCWLIPVINGAGKGNCNEKDPTPIVDWANMCYQSMDINGANSTITADITCGQNINETSNLLCFSNRLVREPVKGM